MNYEKVKQENGSSLNVCLKFVYSSFVFIQILKSDSDILSYSVISQLFQQCLFFAILSIYIIFDGEITISTEKVLWIKKFQMLFEQNIATNVTRNQESKHLTNLSRPIHAQGLRTTIGNI